MLMSCFGSFRANITFRRSVNSVWSGLTDPSEPEPIENLENLQGQSGFFTLAAVSGLLSVGGATLGCASVPHVASGGSGRSLT